MNNFFYTIYDSCISFYSKYDDEIGLISSFFTIIPVLISVFIAFKFKFVDKTNKVIYYRIKNERIYDKYHFFNVLKKDNRTEDNEKFESLKLFLGLEEIRCKELYMTNIAFLNIGRNTIRYNDIPKNYDISVNIDKPLFYPEIYPQHTPNNYDINLKSDRIIIKFEYMEKNQGFVVRFIHDKTLSKKDLKKLINCIIIDGTTKTYTILKQIATIIGFIIFFLLSLSSGLICFFFTYFLLSDNVNFPTQNAESFRQRYIFWLIVLPVVFLIVSIYLTYYFIKIDCGKFPKDLNRYFKNKN